MLLENQLENQVDSSVQLVKKDEILKKSRENLGWSSQKNLRGDLRGPENIAFSRPTLSKNEIKAVLDALVEENLDTEKITENFEAKLANFFSFKRAIALQTSFSSYHLAFLSLDLRKNDLVLLSPFSPRDAYYAASLLGIPVSLVDIAPNSWHPPFSKILSLAKEHKGGRVCYLLDHSFGSFHDFDFLEWEKDENIVIENIVGNLVSALSLKKIEEQEEARLERPNLSICSSNPKDFITTGTGGALFFQDKKLYNRALSLCGEGKTTKDTVVCEYRMRDFLSAMGLGQLKNLKYHFSRRREIAERYLNIVSKTDMESYFQSKLLDSYIEFPILVNSDRESVAKLFRSYKIEVKRITRYPLYYLTENAPSKYPCTERAYQKAFSIPLYPQLSQEEVERISSALSRIG